MRETKLLSQGFQKLRVQTEQTDMTEHINILHLRMVVNCFVSFCALVSLHCYQIVETSCIVPLLKLLRVDSITGYRCCIVSSLELSCCALSCTVHQEHCAFMPTAPGKQCDFCFRKRNENCLLYTSPSPRD